MRILITGGMGYLGGRVSRHLSEHTKNEILIGSRQERTRPSWLKNGRMVQLSSSDHMQGALAGVDIVLHLAAMNEVAAQENPEACYLEGALGAYHLVEAMKANKVKRIIYFSTAHVYRSPLVGHVCESTLPRPIHPYAISHKMSEDLFLAASMKKEIEAVVLRLSNVIGAPERCDVDRWMLVANDLCRQAVQDRVLSLKSSGEQQRDFVPMESACEVILHLLSLPVERLGDGLFNLGRGRSLSVFELAQMVARRCHEKLGYLPQIQRPVPTQNTGGEYEPLLYDVERLRGLGILREFPLEDEIDDMLSFCSQHFMPGRII